MNVINNIGLPYATYSRNHDCFYGNEEFETIEQIGVIKEIIKGIIEEILFNVERLSINSNVVKFEGYEFIVITTEKMTRESFDVFVIKADLLKNLIYDLTAVDNIIKDFYEIIGSMHDDFVIINKDGVIEKVLPNFEIMYGISANEAIGRTVHEMEERKIFNPSVAIRVMKSMEPETLLQLTGAGKYLMCTAIPIKDKWGNLQRIISYTRDVTQYESLKEEFNELKDTLKAYTLQIEQLKKGRDNSNKIIGKSEEILRIQRMIEKISKFDATVLLTGESGVGKNLFAEMIHENSNRKNGPFISINCGAIPENLLESELFGYEKGSFTGANNEGKPGLIELAHQGTLLLDEIGDLPLHMQVKLLKAIQDKKITRIGGIREKEIDFKLIAATNKNMEQLITENKFREDLYYRINVLSIRIPPLRERQEDIFPLINYFLSKYNTNYGINHIFSSKAVDALETYHWPGNIRELQNVIERIVLTADDYVIDVDMLPSYINKFSVNSSYEVSGKTLKEILESVEEKVIIDFYDKYKTTSKVAEVLGISQPSASIKIKKYSARGAIK